jgi:hypothetical protein
MMNFLEIVFSGDLVLDEPHPEHWLSGIAPALHNADLAIGHLEVPHTRNAIELNGDIPAPGADPDHLAALFEAGFNALSPDQDHPLRAEWASRRKELFGFEPDPEYCLAPFHPQAVNSMLGLVHWYSNNRNEAGFIPVYMEPPGRPVIAEGTKAKEIIGYVERITKKAGLPPLSLKLS